MRNMYYNKSLAAKLSWSFHDLHRDQVLTSYLVSGNANDTGHRDMVKDFRRPMAQL